ncbi:MAG: tyrosine-type recombinase/integrase [Planctomycetaceae bacterium]|nr:tyrosine-type recombinase/integrase [Planctomycetaceae bacterium]
MSKAANTPRGLYKRGDVWYSRIAGPDGRLIRKRLSADKQTAILMLNEMRKTTELQKFGVLPRNVHKEIKDCATLKNLFFERLRTRGRRSKTIMIYEFAWKYVIEDNNIVSIDQITMSKIQELVKRLKAKGMRAQSINIYVGVVKAALAWARDFEYIKTNPLARWEKLSKDPSLKRRDFTLDEERRFLAAETNPEYHLLWLLYFRTGLRADAGLAAEWSWILWNEQAMMLPEEHNKSRKDLWIPLDSELFEDLKERHASLPEEKRQGRIFRPISRTPLRKRFKSVCEAAGIDSEGLCLHSIRHTYATASYEASGNNVKVVQELLGHAHGSTSMLYIHATNQQKREAVEQNALRRLRNAGEELRIAE